MVFKILIVEDDEAEAASAAAKLRACGFDVRVIHRGEEAIPTMKEWLPHLVVLDLHLPGMDGIEISQNMRLHPELKNIIKISNSTHMDRNGGLGFYFYSDHVLHHEEVPYMIDKLKPSEGLSNDLASAVGVAISLKFQFVPRGMAEYLEDRKNKRHNPDSEFEDL